MVMTRFMRPVLNVKKMIDTICKPKNNGGYSVELDPAFFNPNNPYYEKAWITLKSIDDMIKNDSTTSIDGIMSDFGQTDIISDYKEELKFHMSEHAYMSELNCELVPTIHLDIDSAYQNEEPMFQFNGLGYYYNNIHFQLVGTDDSDNIVCSSDVYYRLLPFKRFED